MDHENERDYAEERANEAFMRRENEAEYTAQMREDEYGCECSEDYGPCEDHCNVLVSREGAAQRTADELCAVFLSDVVDVLTSMGHEAPTGDAYVTGADYWQAVENERERASQAVENLPESASWQERASVGWVSGWAPEAGTITREDGTSYTWEENELSQALHEACLTGESDLGTHGISVEWEDGYRIYVLTGGPLYVPDEDEDGTQDEAPTEPTYLRNICPTCEAPMMGTHYHEADEDEDEDEDEDGTP